jgi:hypothetical protein
MLDVADSGIGDQLSKYAVAQQQGEVLNQVSEKYFKRFPRDLDDEWPSSEPMDLQLRSFFACLRSSATVEDIKRNAKAELDLDLD